MRNILIVLGITAAVLGVITYFVVFQSSGSYVITGSSVPSIPAAGTSVTIATTTPATPTSSAFVDIPPKFATQFSSPPVTWKEGNDVLSVTGAALTATQLTLKVTVAMGNAGECVPVNIRLVSNESGTLTPPQTANFSFPVTGNCNGAGGGVYKDQPVVFTLDPSSAFPLLITTGGISNTYFEVSTTTTGGIDIELPSSSG